MGRKEEEMEAGWAYGNELFQWVWPWRVCGEEGKIGRENGGRSCLVVVLLEGMKDKKVKRGE